MIDLKSISHSDEVIFLDEEILIGSREEVTVEVQLIVGRLDLELELNWKWQEAPSKTQDLLVLDDDASRDGGMMYPYICRP